MKLLVLSKKLKLLVGWIKFDFYKNINFVETFINKLLVGNWDKLINLTYGIEDWPIEMFPYEEGFDGKIMIQVLFVCINLDHFTIIIY